MIRKLTFLKNWQDTQNPFRNFAVEEYLMNHVEEGEIILFLWQNRNTVVIGRNQNGWHECSVKKLEEDGGLLARRLSGGGAVYHDLGNMNFSFLARKQDYDVAKQLSVIVEGVKAFGIQAEKSGRNDIKINGRKFSGNAFYRHGDLCYHHGTLLIGEDMKDMVKYLNVDGSKMNYKGVKSVPAKVVNLSDLAPAITVESLTDALKESFGKVYCLPVEEIHSADIPEEALKDRIAFFSSWDWRYGAAHEFDVPLEGRWDWGFLKFSFRVDHGMVEEVSVDSDGLEADFIAAIPEALKGKRYEGKELASAVLAMETGTPEEKEVQKDTAKLLGDMP
ncbi:lipoate--protein ligase [uncultured Dialister sp.]|uniref:lipoate--protein ligase n=1 Tax=uncultured Dialister sp. TaxID=278064 RepID=UPI0025DD7AA7|nr:lipoate--protein ligase [uncultured Dialister sp.]